MDPITGTEILRTEQKKLRGLCTQAEVMDQRAPEMKQGVIDELFDRIIIQFALEEEFLLPPLVASMDERNRELAQQTLALAAEVKGLIHGLQRRGIHQENFNTGLSILVTTIEQYFRLETEELFPKIEYELGSLLYEIGPRIYERRAQYLVKNVA